MIKKILNNKYVESFLFYLVLLLFLGVCSTALMLVVEGIKAVGK
jgi:hypothetical protein